jgi:hypothetical protein
MYLFTVGNNKIDQMKIHIIAVFCTDVFANKSRVKWKKIVFYKLRRYIF